MNGWLGNELPAESGPSTRDFGAEIVVDILDDFKYSQKH